PSTKRPDPASGIGPRCVSFTFRCASRARRAAPTVVPLLSPIVRRTPPDGCGEADLPQSSSRFRRRLAPPVRRRDNPTSVYAGGSSHYAAAGEPALAPEVLDTSEARPAPTF